MDEELKKRLADYFDSWDLVELLQLKTYDIISNFEEEVMDALEDLEELMGISNER